MLMRRGPLCDRTGPEDFVFDLSDSSLIPSKGRDEMRNINNHSTIHNRQEAESQFTRALEAHRLKLIDKLIADGEFHRLDATNKPGNSGRNDGKYILHLDGVPRGSFINYTTDNGQWQNWVFERKQPWTEAERQELYERIKSELAEARAKQAAVYERATKKAKRIWDRTEDASAEHPYAVAKKVEPHGLGYRAEKLWVPMFDEKGKLQNLQSIEADGTKRFIKGGRVRGSHYWVAKPKETDSDTICICEGWATGESVFQATKHAVCIAFNAGALTATAKWVRKLYPEHRIVMCADDDRKTEGNPGLTAAQAAAQAVDGLVAVPQFREDRDDKHKDFNDLAATIGLKAVKAAIDAAAAPAEHDDDEDDEEDVRCAGDASRCPHCPCCQRRTVPRRSHRLCRHRRRRAPRILANPFQGFPRLAAVSILEQTPVGSQ